MAGRAVKSIRDLAKLVGLSHAAVGKWLRHAEWKFGAGPWSAADVTRIRAWASNVLSENRAESPGKTSEPATMNLKDLPISKQIDASLKLSRKARLDYDLKVDRGEYHLVDDCKRSRLRQIHEVKTALLNMPDGLPVDADVKIMIKGRVLEILRKWASPEMANGPDSHAAAFASPVAG